MWEVLNIKSHFSEKVLWGNLRELPFKEPKHLFLSLYVFIFLCVGDKPDFYLLLKIFVAFLWKVSEIRKKQKRQCNLQILLLLLIAEVLW